MHLQSGSLNQHVLEFLDTPHTRTRLLTHLRRCGHITHQTSDTGRVDSSLLRLRQRGLIIRAEGSGRDRLLQTTAQGRHVLAGVEDGLSRGETLTLVLLHRPQSPLALWNLSQQLGIHHTRSFYHQHLNSLLAMDLIERHAEGESVHYRVTEWGEDIRERARRLLDWPGTGAPTQWSYLNNTAHTRITKPHLKRTPLPQAAD